MIVSIGIRSRLNEENRCIKSSMPLVSRDIDSEMGISKHQSMGYIARK